MFPKLWAFLKGGSDELRSRMEQLSLTKIILSSHHLLRNSFNFVSFINFLKLLEINDLVMPWRQKVNGAGNCSMFVIQAHLVNFLYTSQAVEKHKSSSCSWSYRMTIFVFIQISLKLICSFVHEQRQRKQSEPYSAGLYVRFFFLFGCYNMKSTLERSNSSEIVSKNTTLFSSNGWNRIKTL